jgi:hypothetical protein
MPDRLRESKHWKPEWMMVSDERTAPRPGTEAVDHVLSHSQTVSTPRTRRQSPGHSGDVVGGRGRCG